MAIRPLIGGDIRLVQDSEIAASCRTVAASTSSVELCSPNIARATLSVFNNSTAILYVLIAAGGNASSSYFTLLLNPGDYWECPTGMNGVHKGAVKGAWASVNGNAMVTETS